jgi:hypothetical protein
MNAMNWGGLLFVALAPVVTALRPREWALNVTYSFQ